MSPPDLKPPPADFTQVYENVATHAGSIVSVHLGSHLSGTHQAAIVGARPVQKTAIAHVDSGSVSVGLGKTMTALDVLEGRMIVVIGLCPVRPAEFIILRIVQTMPVS